MLRSQFLVTGLLRKFIVLGMNEVAVARHGPILKDNEAMSSGKVFKYLPGLRDTITNSKMGLSTKSGLRKKSTENAYFWGTNGVAMARHGLILNDNEAMGSRKVFKYLPGLWDTIKN